MKLYYVDDSKEVGLKVNAEETYEYMFVSRAQNTREKHNINVVNRSFTEFTYFGTTQTNQNCIYDKIKSR